MKPPSTPTHEPPPGMARVVESNIRTLLARHHQEERHVAWQDRLADRITCFTGSMRFVGLHLVLFGLWIVVNLPGVPLPHFDPTYVGLAMVASVEAIFLSTFAQFIGLCSSSKWSRALTKSPFLALLATLGSNAACKISSACSNAVS